MQAGKGPSEVVERDSFASAIADLSKEAQSLLIVGDGCRRVSLLPVELRKTDKGVRSDPVQ
jgi:hypothetical protein